MEDQYPKQGNFFIFLEEQEHYLFQYQHPITVGLLQSTNDEMQYESYQ